MRKALLLAIIAAVGIIPTTSSAGVPVVKACTQEGTTPYQVRNLIRCVAPRLGVSTSTALYIAHRESKFHPQVCNASDHCGVYQDARAIWSYISAHYVYGRAMDSLMGGGCTAGYITPWGRCSGRASVILNLRYVKHHGWQPWS